MLFDIGEVHAPRYARVKRMLDLLLASCGVVVLVVLIPFVVVGNVLGNRGPLLYRQLRVGRGGAAFQIFKLRTMRSVDGVDRSDPTIEGDPRVTPFGRLLRRTHLDELPQVLNMLRGELSVVGPLSGAAASRGLAWRARSPSTGHAISFDPGSRVGRR